MTSTLMRDVWRALGRTMIGRTYRFVYFPRVTFKVLGPSIVAGRVLVLENGHITRSVDLADLAQAHDHGSLETIMEG